MLTLAEVKNNLRLDYDFDDTYLQGLIDTSELFILGAIELKTAPDDKRFKTLQFMLVSLWYENRVPATSALKQQVPFTIVAMIHQLRGLYDVTDTNTTT
ncbi:head-tail adaptor [Enterococcus phage vB_Efa_ZAT1]